MTKDEALLVEAYNFGQYADDACWPLPKPIREALCRICEQLIANTVSSDWAPPRIWLQRGYADGGGHTWCEDSQPEQEQAEYVRVSVDKPLEDTDD